MDKFVPLEGFYGCEFAVCGPGYGTGGVVPHRGEMYKIGDENWDESMDDDSAGSTLGALHNTCGEKSDIWRYDLDGCDTIDIGCNISSTENAVYG